MKTLDLFGNEKEAVFVKKKGQSDYQYRKQNLDYRLGDKNKCCKNCKHLWSFHYHGKNYHKCELIGISQSAATDIRLKNTCKRWEKI